MLVASFYAHYNIINSISASNKTSCEQKSQAIIAQMNAETTFQMVDFGQLHPFGCGWEISWKSYALMALNRRFSLGPNLDIFQTFSGIRFFWIRKPKNNKFLKKVSKVRIVVKVWPKKTIGKDFFRNRGENRDLVPILGVI